MALSTGNGPRGQQENLDRWPCEGRRWARQRTEYGARVLPHRPQLLFRL